MSIGETIRKYRKDLGMTQEELALRLGVTTPAVNKWEKNNTLPDVSLLAPVARILGISTDTLLSYKEDLSDKEISDFLIMISGLLSKDSELTDFDRIFGICGEKIEEYPRSYSLIWQVSVILSSQISKNIPGKKNSDFEKYRKTILDWLKTCIRSEDERIRTGAIMSAFYLVLDTDTEKAEEFLNELSNQNPEKKRLKAILFEKRGETDKALKEYEEIILSSAVMLNLVFTGMSSAYEKAGNMKMAEKLEIKTSEFARVFELGKYQEISPLLNSAVRNKDSEKTIRIMKELLDNLYTLRDFTESELYSHIDKKEMNSDEFTEQIKEKLLSGFRDEEAFGYMKNNEEYRSLFKQ